MSAVTDLLEAPTDMFPVHKLCKAFPRPSAEQQQQLKQHIKEVGLLKPLVCWNDSDKDKPYLIDGLTRNTVIDELLAEGVTVADNGKPIAKVIEWYEGDKASVFEFVIGSNFNRREMSKSQRAGLAVLFADWEKTYKGRTSGNYAVKLAEQSGSNRQYVYDCMKIREKDLALLEEVVAGTMKVKEALAKALGTTPEVATEEAGPPEPEPVYDGRKQEVEPEYREIFEARAEFNKVLKLIRTADMLMKDLKSSKGGKTITDELFPEFRNLRRQCRSVMPHAVCPYCSGTGKNAETGTGRCPQCKGHKYLDAIQWGIVPDDLKGVVAGSDDRTEE